MTTCLGPEAIPRWDTYYLAEQPKTQSKIGREHLGMFIVSSHQDRFAVYIRIVKFFEEWMGGVVKNSPGFYFN